MRSTAVFEQEADTALEPPGEDSPGARALEPVAEVCEQGALWLTIAADTPDLLARARFVAMATSLLERARDMARNAPSAALNTPEQAEWLAIIAAALAEADVLR